MISFLHPGYLLVATGVAAVIVGLHFLVTEQARYEILPTVRFFPASSARATSLVLRFGDPLLLLIRVLTVLLLGAAFAQPRLQFRRSRVARIVAVDLSEAGSRRGARDSAARYTHDAAVVIVFDSSAREIPPSTAADSIAASLSKPLAAYPPHSFLSSALITALHAAARERDHADSVELLAISGFTSQARDAATPDLRALWPGHIRTVPVSLLPQKRTAPAKDARITVQWADSGTSPFWHARTHPDTVGGVGMPGAVLIYPFVRRWTARLQPNDGSRVFARWYDGEAAAVERRADGGCLRSVGFSLPAAGDAALRTEFVRFANSLRAPCGERREVTLLSSAFLDSLRGSASAAASASAIRPRSNKSASSVPWLLAAAFLLALAELSVRRRRDSSHAAREIATSEGVGPSRRGRAA